MNAKNSTSILSISPFHIVYDEKEFNGKERSHTLVWSEYVSQYRKKNNLTRNNRSVILISVSEMGCKIGEKSAK